LNVVPKVTAHVPTRSGVTVNVALGPAAAVAPVGVTVAMPRQVSDSLNVPAYPKALTAIDCATEELLGNESDVGLTVSGPPTVIVTMVVPTPSLMLTVHVPPATGATFHVAEGPTGGLACAVTDATAEQLLLTVKVPVKVLSLTTNCWLTDVGCRNVNVPGVTEIGDVGVGFGGVLMLHALKPVTSNARAQKPAGVRTFITWKYRQNPLTG
jgi:hypothetical protein